MYTFYYPNLSDDSKAVDGLLSWKSSLFLDGISHGRLSSNPSLLILIR